ncbi:hypothetical protein HVA01_17220 [Halovibrio variabilis]|uniref:Uncharacterized protein n=1 Tax=Halovibrio variabilis TaxID=31910 RepID=A0A511UN75_9GAMM|nr:hypothetical protein HVA01_17220 [Halovibrio variabilis]
MAVKRLGDLLNGVFGQLGIRMQKQQRWGAGLLCAQVHLPRAARLAAEHLIRQWLGGATAVIAAAAVHHNYFGPLRKGLATQRL